MIAFSPTQIARAARAELVAGPPEPAGPDDTPGRAVVDSRQAGPGDLFVGLAGEHADGGEFAAAAIEVGAWGAIVTHAHAAAARAAARDRGARVFAADDPLESLGSLAGAWVDRLREQGASIVGITGSTGKTSTKDILLALARPALRGHVHANRENFNTEVGLPLTVLEAGEATQLVVLEMAMRGLGQIRDLARIARPDVGVITNVGPVHLELVGTLENVAAAKAELIAELAPGAVCVVPAGEQTLVPHLRTDVRTIAVGDDVRALSVEPAADGLAVEVAAGEERASFEFNFSQAHNVTNALAAIAALYALGLPLHSLAEGAGAVRFSSLRGEELDLPGGVAIINDCYNANPVSMRAAIDHLAALATRRGAKRLVAVLGDMRELGPDAAAFHREIGAHAAQVGVDVLVAVGDHAGDYAQGFGGPAHEVGDAEQAAETTGELLRDGDLVLVKASRAVGLERVAQVLQATRGAVV